MPTFPLHLPATRTDKVKFFDGSTSDYQPPVNTMDPRYAACTDHRVACDCREAELREDIVEYRAEYRLLKAAIEKVVGEHEQDTCGCAGCQIVRLTHDSGFWRTVLS